jgi:formiminotetrahydrofolate cyclodeaminase
MEFHEQTIDSFLELLSSKAAVPGGGGASALVGSVAASLSHMVAALTVGKAKYADVEGEMQGVLAESERITKRFLSLMDEDASAFAPLAEDIVCRRTHPSRLLHGQTLWKPPCEPPSNRR